MIMQNKLFKGFFIMLGIIFAAIQQGQAIWPLPVVTAILTGLGYYVKNYLYQSNSDQGQVTFRDIVSTLILAIIAGLTDSITQIIVNDVFVWVQVWKIIGTVVISYFTATFFEGQKTK